MEVDFARVSNWKRLVVTRFTYHLSLSYFVPLMLHKGNDILSLSHFVPDMSRKDINMLPLSHVVPDMSSKGNNVLSLPHTPSVLDSNLLDSNSVFFKIIERPLSFKI